MTNSSLKAFETFQKKLKFSLLPAFAILFIAYLVAKFYFPGPEVSLGLFWGFLLGYFNIWSMTFLIGKMLAPGGENTKKASWAVLLAVKVVVLFAMIFLGYSWLGLNLMATALGYLLVLFVVVLMSAVGYKPAQ